MHLTKQNKLNNVCAVYMQARC